MVREVSEIHLCSVVADDQKGPYEHGKPQSYRQKELPDYTKIKNKFRPLASSTLIENSEKRKKVSSRRHSYHMNQVALPAGFQGNIPNACSTFIEAECDISDIAIQCNETLQFIPMASSTLNCSEIGKSLEQLTISRDRNRTVKPAISIHKATSSAELSKPRRLSLFRKKSEIENTPRKSTSRMGAFSSNIRNKLMKIRNSTPKSQSAPSFHFDSGMCNPDAVNTVDSLKKDKDATPIRKVSSMCHIQRKDPDGTSVNDDVSRGMAGTNFKTTHRLLKESHNYQHDTRRTTFSGNKDAKRASLRKVKSLPNHFQELENHYEYNYVSSNNELNAMNEKNVLKKIRKLSKSLRKEMPSKIVMLATL